MGNQNTSRYDDEYDYYSDDYTDRSDLYTSKHNRSHSISHYQDTDRINTVRNNQHSQKKDNPLRKYYKSIDSVQKIPLQQKQNQQVIRQPITSANFQIQSSQIQVNGHQNLQKPLNQTPIQKSQTIPSKHNENQLRISAQKGQIGNQGQNNKQYSIQSKSPQSSQNLSESAKKSVIYKPIQEIKLPQNINNSVIHISPLKKVTKTPIIHQSKSPNKTNQPQKNQIITQSPNQKTPKILQKNLPIQQTTIPQQSQQKPNIPNPNTLNKPPSQQNQLRYQQTIYSSPIKSIGQNKIQYISSGIPSSGTPNTAINNDNINKPITHKIVETPYNRSIITSNQSLNAHQQSHGLTNQYINDNTSHYALQQKSIVSTNNNISTQSTLVNQPEINSNPVNKKKISPVKPQLLNFHKKLELLDNTTQKIMEKQKFSNNVINQQQQQYQQQQQQQQQQQPQQVIHNGASKNQQNIQRVAHHFESFNDPNFENQLQIQVNNLQNNSQKITNTSSSPNNQQLQKTCSFRGFALGSNDGRNHIQMETPKLAQQLSNQQIAPKLQQFEIQSFNQPQQSVSQNQDSKHFQPSQENIDDISINIDIDSARDKSGKKKESTPKHIELNNKYVQKIQELEKIKEQTNQMKAQLQQIIQNKPGQEASEKDQQNEINLSQIKQLRKQSGIRNELLEPEQELRNVAYNSPSASNLDNTTKSLKEQIQDQNQGNLQNIENKKNENKMVIPDSLQSKIEILNQNIETIQQKQMQSNLSQISQHPESFNQDITQKTFQSTQQYSQQQQQQQYKNKFEQQKQTQHPYFNNTGKNQGNIKPQSLNKPKIQENKSQIHQSSTIKNLNDIVKSISQKQKQKIQEIKQEHQNSSQSQDKSIRENIEKYIQQKSQNTPQKSAQKSQERLSSQKVLSSSQILVSPLTQVGDFHSQNTSFATDFRSAQTSVDRKREQQQVNRSNYKYHQNSTSKDSQQQQIQLQEKYMNSGQKQKNQNGNQKNHNSKDGYFRYSQIYENLNKTIDKICSKNQSISNSKSLNNSIIQENKQQQNTTVKNLNNIFVGLNNNEREQ